MNQKELSEIRRHLRPDRHSISRIYGCYVNNSGEIIADLEESTRTMAQEEVEKYLSLFRKALSGGLGRNLMDLAYTTAQVMDSDEHRLMMALRDSALEDVAARQELYRRIISAVEMEDCNYLILLAADAYDVPAHGGDGEAMPEASDEVYRFFLCCICPVKAGKVELGYFSEEKQFHSYLSGHTVAAPERGFLFPAFDGRRSNIYSALYYSRDAADLCQPLIDALFRLPAPMSAEEQRSTFQDVLTQALDKDCSFEVVQAVHEQLRERIQEHKESRDPETLDLTAQQVAEILEQGGVPRERAEDFRQRCGSELGDDARLIPENIIDAKRFEVRTPEVKITVDPAYSYLVETRIISGKKYVLIDASGGVEINGMGVTVTSY